MTPEERLMLQETRQLVEENAVILKSIQRTNRVNTFMKALYWVFIIAVSFGAYYLIQPYVNMLKSSLNDLGVTDPSSQSSSFGDALKNIRELQSFQ
jgi:hypothetical protein